MYIKKHILVICSIILIIAVSVGTVMIMNPFGALNFGQMLKFRTGVDVLQRYFYKEIDKDLLVDQILLGASSAAQDPYTIYMGKEVARQFMEDVDQEDYSGVGLYITKAVDDDFVSVSSVIAESPAEKGNILSGDKIIRINGEELIGMTAEQVAAKMKGKEGTTVDLTVEKIDGKVVEVTLTRGVIKRETVSGTMLDNKVAYIRITQFALNTYDEFVQYFNDFAEKGMAHLVIDLRNNPGGYVDTATRIADCFVEKGDIVYTVNRQGQRRHFAATPGSTKVPMVILVNGASASASEIFAGAMMDYDLATIVGQQTYGKGVTQMPFQFMDGSLMNITDSVYYTPGGKSLDGTGITPDVVVEITPEENQQIQEGKPETDRQLQKAIEILLNK